MTTIIFTFMIFNLVVIFILIVVLMFVFSEKIVALRAICVIFD